MSAQETTDTTINPRTGKPFVNWKDSEKQPWSVLRKFLTDKNLSAYPPKDTNDRSAYYEAGVIRKEDLEDGAYYWGTCRHGPIALWDGEHFWYIRNKFKATFAESINHLEDDNGYDLFIPLKKVELGDINATN